MAPVAITLTATRGLLQTRHKASRPTYVPHHQWRHPTTGLAQLLCPHTSGEHISTPCRRTRPMAAAPLPNLAKHGHPRTSPDLSQTLPPKTCCHYIGSPRDAPAAMVASAAGSGRHCPAARCKKNCNKTHVAQRKTVTKLVLQKKSTT